jgi:hypothetical protein
MRASEFVTESTVVKQGLTEDLEQQFDRIEEYVEYMAEMLNVDAEQLWESLESIDDQQLLNEAEAWQTSRGKNKNGGLNNKGVASYRKSHPGSHLQTAVTTKPSKLKKGSKASKRRKSFCARMKGMKKHRAGAKTKRDPNSRINKALRKWHCESVEELQQLLILAESKGTTPGGFVVKPLHIGGEVDEAIGLKCAASHPRSRLHARY